MMAKRLGKVRIIGRKSLGVAEIIGFTPTALVQFWEHRTATRRHRELTQNQQAMLRNQRATLLNQQKMLQNQESMIKVLHEIRDILKERL
jgi:hypothetical protein